MDIDELPPPYTSDVGLLPQGDSESESEVESLQREERQLLGESRHTYLTRFFLTSSMRS